MRTIVLFTTLSLLTACSPYQNVEIKDENGVVVENYRVWKSSGLKDGDYKKYSQGQLIETAHYINDTLDGLRTLYAPEGYKEIEEWYVMGIYDGTYQTFYPNGQVRLEGQYVSGRMEGEWTKYYDSGKLMEKVMMHDNAENGPFIEYWENGNLKAEGSYLDGDNEDGELKLYDEQGVLEKTMQCQRGICHTTWKREVNPVE